MINFEELKKFIAEARKNTYAGGGKPVEKPLSKDSCQLEYRKGGYFYRDIYFPGKDNFIGQEVVYLKDKPIWSMVYCGSAEPPEVRNFLKKSLTNLAEKCRFNEECEFGEGGLKYENEGEGTLEQFHGKESVSAKGEKVYRLRYQGGSIVE
jgi:hypothetical protein